LSINVRPGANALGPHEAPFPVLTNDTHLERSPNINIECLVVNFI